MCGSQLRPFLGQDYAFPAPDASADEAAPDASADDLLIEIMPEGHDERGEDRPGMVYDLTHLRKRLGCDTCQAKIKMFPARRENPAFAGASHRLGAHALG